MYISMLPFWFPEIPVSWRLSGALAVLRSWFPLLQEYKRLISLSTVSVLRCAIIFLMVGMLGVVALALPFLVTVLQVVVGWGGKSVGWGV